MVCYKRITPKIAIILFLLVLEIKFNNARWRMLYEEKLVSETGFFQYDITQ